MALISTSYNLLYRATRAKIREGLTGISLHLQQKHEEQL